MPINEYGMLEVAAQCSVLTAQCSVLHTVYAFTEKTHHEDGERGWGGEENARCTRMATVDVRRD